MAPQPHPFVPETAFVLGAGLGTRLKALTQCLPKPLIPVENRPLITHAFDHLIAAGVRRFVVNTHWLSGEYTRAFPDRTYAGCPVHFVDEQPAVLETAGGLKNAEPLLRDQPFVVYNGDILTSLPLDRVFDAHHASGNEVTLVLRSHGGPLQVSWDAVSGRVTDIGCRIHPDRPASFLFTGVYVVEPRFLNRIPTGQKLGVVPVFIDMIEAGAPLGAVCVDEGDWWDLGTREQYIAVHQARVGNGPWISPDALVDPDSELRGASAVGAGAVIGAGCVLDRCIVWPGARIEAGSRLSRCIVTGGRPVHGTHFDADL
jgi:mannose-1-phosphate guanylyltransferase